MNTTAVYINSRLYNNAVEYARRHNTSIDSLVESYIMALMTIMPLDDMVEVPNKESDVEKKSIPDRRTWQNMPISEETMRLLPKRRVMMPDDLNTLFEQKLSEKYEPLHTTPGNKVKNIKMLG